MPLLDSRQIANIDATQSRNLSRTFINFNELYNILRKYSGLATRDLRADIQQNANKVKSH